MFALIKREIYDNNLYFIASLVSSILLSAAAVFIVYYSVGVAGLPALIVNIFFIPTIGAFVSGAMAMGVSQMYSDRNRKVSSFLSTLAASRDQILIARISVGILAILTFVIPVLITSTIIFNFLIPPIPILKKIFLDIFSISILTSLACYCIGLLTGWTTVRFLPVLAGLPFFFIFVTIIIIKGFGIQTVLLLTLFIVASLVQIRNKFLSTPL